jgi:hypothetical protein
MAAEARCDAWQEENSRMRTLTDANLLFDGRHLAAPQLEFSVLEGAAFPQGAPPPARASDRRYEITR